MTENKSKFFNKENLFTALLGGASINDWMKSEVGKEVAKKISGKIFGIGPNDEALFKKACNTLLDDILKLDKNTQTEERKVIMIKITNFLKFLKKKGYSTWWFRNVLATMRKGDSEDKMQAAETLGDILSGKDFDQMLEIAGPDLIQKTYFKKASEGWEIVTGKNGKMNLLVNFSKLKNKSSGIIEKAQDNFKGGFWDGLKIAGLISLGFVIFIIIAFNLF